MSFELLTMLFIFALIMFFGGFLWRLGGDISDISTDVASTLALMVVYGIVLVSVDNASEFTQAICGGIPFIDTITDYGSLREAFLYDKAQCAASFFDVVLLSGIVDLTKPLLGAGRRSKMSMGKILAGAVSALIGLVILNTIVKTSDIYANIVTGIGAVISIFSLSNFSFTAIAALNKKNVAATGIFALAALFMDNPISNAVRMSFIKAVIYVLIIWMMEHFCGSLAGGVSLVFSIIAAFIPAVVMLIGIVIIIRNT